jgi:hypothetical protein
MNKMKSLRFPVKGVGGLSLMFSEAFGVVIVVAMVSAIVSSIGIVYRGVRVLVLGVEVSSIVGSKSRGIGLSEFRGVKVLGCAVKIQACLLVSLHFC